MFRKTIIVIEHDGLETRAFSLTFLMRSKDFPLREAIKAACSEYCHTPEGRKTFEHNCYCFNWADFDAHIPNELCMKHGFSVEKEDMADEIVDWDEQLVDLVEVEDEELL